MSAIHRLSHLKVLKINRAGIFEDGGGLRLVVGESLNKRWVVRVTIHGQRKERGLGKFPDVSLEDARLRASEFRAFAKQGKDLAAEKKKAAIRTTTFQQAFDGYFAIKSKSLSNVKHSKQWESTMTTYVFPKLGARAVADISSAEILQVLTPIWFTKPETARRVLQRMEAVFKSSILRGTRSLASPCIGVVQELGVGHRVVAHHAAMHWTKVPAFIVRLKAGQASTATKLSFEFLILTAARSGEVRGATWDEIDLERKEWRVPAGRMKARRDHIVPLSKRAIEVLKEARSVKDSAELIFPGKSGLALSDMVYTKLLRDMNLSGEATAHGFRSTFKVWCSEVAKVRDEVSEACLAHQIPDKVRAAYLRTDFLEERRTVMEKWSKQLASSNRP